VSNKLKPLEGKKMKETLSWMHNERASTQEKNSPTLLRVRESKGSVAQGDILRGAQQQKNNNNNCMLPSLFLERPEDKS